MATILGIILGFLKVLPQVLDLFKALKENANIVATQQANQKAVLNYETKINATADFIKLHTESAINQLRGNAEPLRENELPLQQQSTVDTTIPGSSSTNS